MKKLTLLLLCIMIAIGSCSCGKQEDSGASKAPEIKEVASEKYSKEEIDEAIGLILKEFEEWEGCAMTQIYYAGDEISADHQGFADRNDADEVLVLKSSFDVDASGGKDGSFDPNMTYDDWKWILVRESGGEWKHVDHGY